MINFLGNNKTKNLKNVIFWLSRLILDWVKDFVVV